MRKMPVLVCCGIYWVLCPIQYQKKELHGLYALVRMHFLCCNVAACRIYKFYSLWCCQTRYSLYEDPMDNLSPNLLSLHSNSLDWPFYLSSQRTLLLQGDRRDPDIWQVTEDKSRLRLTRYSWSLLWRFKRVWQIVKVLQKVDLWQVWK